MNVCLYSFTGIQGTYGLVAHRATTDALWVRCLAKQGIQQRIALRAIWASGPCTNPPLFQIVV